MEIKFDDLSKDHPIVKAAHRMVEFHDAYDSMNPALDDAKAEFPEITYDQLALLWIGINAKDVEEI